MELTKFKIDELFGHIDEDLTFNTNSSILFIAGKNGSGKTTILKTIDAIAKKNWHYLLKTNFKEVSLEFSDEQKIKVTKKKTGDGFDLNFSSEKKTNPKVKVEEVELYDSHNVNDLVEELLKSNTIWQLDCGHYADEENNHMTETKILKKYGKLKIKIPKYINNLLTDWNTVFISADRQISNTLLRKKEKRIKVYEVENIVNNLKESLNKVQTKVRENLDNKNVNLVKKLYEDGLKSFDDISQVQFDELMKDFIEKKQTLQKSGLSVGNLSTDDVQKKSDIEQKLVAHIIRETLDAYEPYEKLLFSMKLFDSIVNSAISKKTVAIELPNGLDVQIKKDGEVEKFSPLILSSGEQQVVILAYKLLFEAKENDLVLIDEPELSMDVDWQTRIYGWLKKISKERHLKMLLSTHSPLIVMGKDDSIISLSK